MASRPASLDDLRKRFGRAKRTCIVLGVCCLISVMTAMVVYPHSTIGRVVLSDVLGLNVSAHGSYSRSWYAYAVVFVDGKLDSVFKNHARDAVYVDYVFSLWHEQQQAAVTLFVEVESDSKHVGFLAPTRRVDRLRIAPTYTDPKDVVLSTDLQQQAIESVVADLASTEPEWSAEFGHLAEGGASTSESVLWAGVAHAVLTLGAILLLVPACLMLKARHRTLRMFKHCLSQGRCPECSFPLIGMDATRCQKCDTSLVERTRDPA